MGQTQQFLWWGRALPIHWMWAKQSSFPSHIIQPLSSSLLKVLPENRGPPRVTAGCTNQTPSPAPSFSVWLLPQSQIRGNVPGGMVTKKLPFAWDGAVWFSQVDWILTNSHRPMLHGLSFTLYCSGLGIPVWGWDPTLPWSECFPAAYSSGLPAVHQLAHPLCLSSWFSSMFPALHIPDQLHFTWCLKPLVLQFGRKSRTVSGASAWNLQLPCCHLGIPDGRLF